MPLDTNLQTLTDISGTAKHTVDASGNVTAAGSVSAASVASTAGVSGTTGAFTGAVSGTTGTFTSGLAGATSVMPAVADPGDAAAIPVTGNASIAITTAAAETNTLAIPTFAGQLLSLICDVHAVGDRVVTVAAAVNQTGNNTLTFGAAADHIVLVGAQVAGALVWRVLANDGVALTTV